MTDWTDKYATDSHPCWEEMIAKAVIADNDPSGSSRVVISKYILANYKIEEDIVKLQLKFALKTLTERDIGEPRLIQIKQSFTYSPELYSKYGLTVSSEIHTKKIKTVKKLKAHPSWDEMIAKAVIANNEYNGTSSLSRSGISKYILANYRIDETVVKSQLKHNLKRLSERPVGEPRLIQVKQSFKASPELKAKYF
jgi:hypothetical protein